MEYTKKDLMFTWGVVESREHAEYIIKIAKRCGVRMGHIGGHDFESFSIDSDGLYLWYSKESGAEYGYDQITIPLPPKEKEWPKVGDEVTWGSEVLSGEVKCVFDGWAWVKDSHGGFVSIRSSILKKPKSKQDLLIEELHQKLLANNCSDEYLLACDIVQGKIEGLSYE